MKTFLAPINRAALHFLTLVFIAVGAASPAYAIDVDVVFDNNELRPNAYVFAKIIVANRDGQTRNNVTLTAVVPTSSRVFISNILPATTNCSSTCSAGQVANWNLGDIPNGETRVIHLPVFINNGTASGTAINLTATVDYDGAGSTVDDTANATVRTAPEAVISINAAHQTVRANTNIKYEISFGNIDNTGITGTSLRASIPSGTTFVSASDGGSVSGNEVVWDTGTFNAGQSEKRYFTVKSGGSAANATVYRATARFIDNGSDLAIGEELVVINNATRLTLDVAITGDVRTPGERHYVRYIVANNGSTDLTGVTFNVMTATHTGFEEAYTQMPVICPNSTCDVGEWGFVTIGDLDAGESRTILTQVYGTSSIIDGVPLVSQVRVTDSTNAFTLGTKPTVLYSDDQSLRMSMTANKQVVGTSEQVEYEISFGNVDSSAYQNLVLEVDLPPSTLFVGASDSGVLSNGVVTWQIGTLNAGDSGKRYLKVNTGGILPEGLVSVNQARLHTGEESLSRSSEGIVIKEDVPLSLDVSITGDVNFPDQRTYFRYVIANSGEFDLTDVTFHVATSAYTYISESATTLPVICPNSTCDPGELGFIDLGVLEPGDSRVIMTPIIRNNVLNGSPLVSHALVTEGSGAYTLGTKPTVLSSNDSSLSLSITADQQVIASQDEIRYEVSFGNVDSVAYQNLVLEADLPANTSLVTVSDGGVLNNGVITWDLGTMNAGTSSKRFFTVRTNAGLDDALVLANKARMHQGGESLARAGESVVIRSEVDLTLDVTVTGDIRTPGMYTYYRYVIANTGELDLTNIALEIMAAKGSFINESFTQLPVICPNSTCDNNELGVVNIERLEPGQSEVVLVPVNATGSSDGAPWVSHAFVRDSSNAFTLGTKPTVLFDSSPSLMLALAADKQVVASGDSVQYEVSFGNVDSQAYQNLVLEVEIPEGASFVEASSNGTHSQGVVSWDLGTLNSSKNDKQFVTVTMPMGLPDGETLIGRASIHSGGPSLVRASDSSVVKAGIELSLDTAFSAENLPHWDVTHLQYTIVNSGSTDITDVTLQLLSGVGVQINESETRPIFNCTSFSCDAGEFGFLTIGEIEAGESVSVNLPVAYTSSAVNGSVMSIQSRLTAAGLGATLGEKSTLLFRERGIREPDLVLQTDKMNPQIGSLQEVSIKVGNPTDSIINNALLELEIPLGYSIVSRSGRAILQGGNLIWPQGNIPVGRWLEETVTLRVNSAVAVNDTLKLSAVLRDESDTNVVSRGSIVSVVSPTNQLDLSLSDSFTAPLGYGDVIAWNLRTSNNESTQLADVNLAVNLPYGTAATSLDSATGCSTCDYNDWPTWALGNLDPGQEVNRTIMFGIYNSSFSGAPPGNIMLAIARLSHTSSPVRDLLMNKTWGVGTEYSVGTNFDSDNDQIPDWWELAFGLDRLSSADANIDSDGDGDSNLVEYQQGRNPNKPDGDLDADNDGVIDRFDAAPRDPSVSGRTLFNIDDNETPDLFAVGELSGTKQAMVYDAVTAVNSETYTLPSWFVHEFTVPVGDADGDGKWDLMIFGETPRGAKVRYIQSGAYSSELQQLTYPGFFVPTVHKDAKALADINGNKRSEVALLVERTGGRDAIMVYDSAVGYNKATTSKTYPNTLIRIILLPGWFEGESIHTLSDWNGNGSSELAVLGKSPAGTPIWLKYDSLTGGSLGQGTYPGWFTADKMMLGPDINGNGTESLVTLGRTTGGANLWIAQDGRSGSQIRVGVYPGWLTPLNITFMPDDNGDGVADVITLAETPSGNALWRRTNINTNALQRQKSYPGWFTPEKLEIIIDVNSNGEPELVTFGESSSNRKLWLIDDGFTGARSTSPINLPVGFSQ